MIFIYYVGEIKNFSIPPQKQKLHEGFYETLKFTEQFLRLEFIPSDFAIHW